MHAHSLNPLQERGSVRRTCSHSCVCVLQMSKKAEVGCCDTSLAVTLETHHRGGSPIAIFRREDGDLGQLATLTRRLVCTALIATQIVLLALRYGNNSVVVDVKLYWFNMPVYVLMLYSLGYEMLDVFVLIRNKIPFVALSAVRCATLVGLLTTTLWYDVRQVTWTAIVDYTNTTTQALLITQIVTFGVYVVLFLFASRLISSWSEDQDHNSHTTYADKVSLMSKSTSEK
jgi:hypothetical protein